MVLCVYVNMFAYPGFVDTAAVLSVFMLYCSIEGLMEDWLHQMSYPHKIKNLLTLLKVNAKTKG